MDSCEGRFKSFRPELFARVVPKVFDPYFSKIFNLREPKYLSSTIKFDEVTIETPCYTIQFFTYVILSLFSDATC